MIKNLTITLLTLLVLVGCNDSSYSSKEITFIDSVENNSMMEGQLQKVNGDFNKVE